MTTRYSKHSEAGSRREPRERVGPAVVGLGRGWGRGSGVVIAPGRVLTNAHVLRGDEVAVTFADGEVARRPGGRRRRRPRRRRGRASTPATRAAVAWEPAGERRSARRAGVRARQPRRPRPAHDVRARVRHRARLPRPARAPHRRLDRAHGAAPARLLRRAARRRRRAPARPQHRAPRGRADPRAARRRGAAAPRRGARPRRGGRAPAARRRARAAARRARACAPRSACRSATACSCAASVDGSPAARAGLERGDLLVRGRRASRSRASTTCSTRSTAPADTLALDRRPRHRGARRRRRA